MPLPLPAASRAFHFVPPISRPNDSKKDPQTSPWEREDQRTRGRLRKGTRTEDAWPLQDPFSPPPAFSAFEESGFAVQEYLQALIHGDPRDVERIAALPVEHGEEGREAEDQEGPLTLVAVDCWVYEQLRRLSLDLTLWVVHLQKECSRETCPDMRAQEWLFLCAAHTLESESGCCAIDYIQHTLDGATALLNSVRYFPSRLNIPDSSLKHFTAIARRLYRIFAHAFFHHREIFDECEAETCLYERFLALTANFDLVDAELLVIPLGKEDITE